MRSQRDTFVAYYAAMTDEELLCIAANQRSLVPVAQTALVAELSKRQENGLAVPVIEKREPTGDPWLLSWLWPTIWDQESAKKASRKGAGAAYAICVVTGIFSVVSMFRPLSFAQPLGIIDVVIFASLGFAMNRKMSRVAAVGALAMYVFERLYDGMAQELNARVGGVSLFLLLQFVSGVRGSFAYRVYAKTGPTNRE